LSPTRIVSYPHPRPISLPSPISPGLYAISVTHPVLTTLKFSQSLSPLLQDFCVALPDVPIYSFTFTSMMDPFEELKRMESNAKANDVRVSEDDDLFSEQVANWQRIFHYSWTEAIVKIEEHRADIARPTVSDEVWILMRSKLDGYDREAFEHELSLNQTSPSRPAASVDSKAVLQPVTQVLLKLGRGDLSEPLSTRDEVQAAARMSAATKVFTGDGEDGGGVTFCQLDTIAQEHVRSYLIKIGSRFQPMFVPYSQATKDLDEHSAYPMLGLDTTLPQNRLQNEKDLVKPRQSQYPVQYFFYGTLADPQVLTRVLLLRHPPTYQLATIAGGILKTWASKYKALVDGPSEAKVNGWAYCVETEEHESALRSFETAKYEVVRCVIILEDGIEQPGCTFRFTDAAALA